ncbi:tetratricopeptide repeat protein [Undibacterium sp. JH2W]|uniref:tetratricopeptide repeat protein n=1 Tax=Undibacterium sp. JH2W TaxID=3413037 RepID=UPI003BF2C98B
MRLLINLLISSSLILLPPAWAQENKGAVNDEAPYLQVLNEGATLIKAGKAKEAIPYFDKVIARYEDKYRDSKQTIFCARSPTEALAYLLEAANQAKGSAMVLSANWADAYYLKAYVLVSLGQFAQARSVLAHAIALSPANFQYQAELGHIYQQEKNWDLALSSFQLAETNARTYSAPATHNAEIAQAMRGKAYVLVEQGKLDEAEQVYLQCLELDKNDVRARNELTYVQGLKSKQKVK